MKRLSLLMILIVLMLLIVTGCKKQSFVGDSTGNNVQFIMDYSILNGTKTHEIKLEKGASVNVIIENESGKLDILVADTNGEEIYKGNNATSRTFSLKILKADTYKFSVTGSNAKGSVSFKVAD